MRVKYEIVAFTAVVLSLIERILAVSGKERVFYPGINLSQPLCFLPRGGSEERGINDATRSAE